MHIRFVSLEPGDTTHFILRLFKLSRLKIRNFPIGPLFRATSAFVRVSNKTGKLVSFAFQSFNLSNQDSGNILFFFLHCQNVGENSCKNAFILVLMHIDYLQPKKTPRTPQSCWLPLAHSKDAGWPPPHPFPQSKASSCFFAASKEIVWFHNMEPNSFLEAANPAKAKISSEILIGKYPYKISLLNSVKKYPSDIPKRNLYNMLWGHWGKHVLKTPQKNRAIFFCNYILLKVLGPCLVPRTTRCLNVKHANECLWSNFFQIKFIPDLYLLGFPFCCDNVIYLPWQSLVNDCIIRRLSLFLLCFAHL